MIVLTGWGALSLWVAELVTKAADRSTPPISPERVGAYDDLRDLGFGTARLPRLLLTQGPGVSFHKAVGSQDLRIVCVLETPAEAVDYCRRTTGVPRSVALRAVSQSMAGHLSIRGHLGGCLIFRSNELNARDHATRIISHLGLQVARDVWRDLLDRLCGSEEDALTLDQALERMGHGPEQPQANDWIKGTNVDHSAIAAAFNPVIRMACGHPIEPIMWQHSLFYRGAETEVPAPRRFDLTGPARLLFGGPLLHLPPAIYTIDICFKFNGQDPIPYLIEFCWLGTPDAPPPVQSRIEKAPAGHYRASLQLPLDRPQDVLDIRVTSLEAAIDGEFELEHIALTPLLG